MLSKTLHIENVLDRGAVPRGSTSYSLGIHKEDSVSDEVCNPRARGLSRSPHIMIKGQGVSNMEHDTLRGLSKVRVSKEFLLTKIRENRIQHEKSYHEILDARQEKIIKDLEESLKKAKVHVKEQLGVISRNKEAHIPSFSVGVSAPLPENHSTDYDKVIMLLEASLDTEFELSSSEFNQYVNDDWSWKTSFTSCSGIYMPDPPLLNFIKTV